MIGVPGKGVALVLAAALCAIAPAAAAQTLPGIAIPRTPDGKPDLSGFWQVSNTAAWDLSGR